MTKPDRNLPIGETMFRPASLEIIPPSGEPVALRPQTARVLDVLLERRGSVVSKDELMDIVWRDTHVTDDSLVQCISEIRKALGPNDSQLLATIPKTGYRLSGGRPEPALPARRTARVLVPGLAVLLVLVAAAAALWWPQAETPGAPITIAVMPFRNMSGEADQQYLSNGVAEDLIVSLSRISDLRVLSRGTTFSIDHGGTDPREIAKRLRADYVLEGSVRRMDKDLRVSASLVDGTSGTNVWADRYEGSTTDMFRFQKDVLDKLVRVLSVRLSPAERDRLGVHGTGNIAAHDAYLRGRELENLYTQETNLAAEGALKLAIREDPAFALAHAHLAQVYSFRVENKWTQERGKYVDAAFDAARNAVRLEPDLPFAHFSLGRLYTRSYAPDIPLAIAEYEKAIALDPNYVDAYMFLANVHIFDGKAEKALPLIRSGFERNPLPPYWYYLADGMANYFLGHYDRAEAALVQARDQNPTAPFPYRFLIATYGQSGNTDEAEWMAMEYEALGRSATVSDLLETAAIHDPTYRGLFADGFRKAGLPEN
ncbi:winged helix-turn-helix domain-containing tetratricopeptide repeat protein [Zhengella mangrovi]|nr:winged helix-turn-helix domain-containing protein [Zhengella mangrovi]